MDYSRKRKDKKGRILEDLTVRNDELASLRGGERTHDEMDQSETTTCCVQQSVTRV